MSFMEEDTLTPLFDTRVSEDLKPDVQSSKRKLIQRTVVKVKIEAYGGKQKNEGPPSDFWSWRKYGQKPIKGSPYPRGYYKCSTSKGCSAKKQVERCRTDASLLLITYTSSHNHDLDLQNTQKQLKEAKTKPIQEEIPTSPNQEQQPLNNVASDEETSEDHFHYLQSPSNDILISQLEENPFTIDQLESNHDQLLGLVYDEDPISLMNFSTAIKSDENDHFFDELEELPMFSSSYNNNTLMGSSLFDERILLQPS